MGWQAWLTFAVVVAMFVVMVRGIAHPAAAILSAVIALLAAGRDRAGTGLLRLLELGADHRRCALRLARAVEDTGALRPLVARRARRRRRRAHQPAAALPPVRGRVGLPQQHADRRDADPARLGVGRAHSLSASRFLMPLSFGVILGGVVTTIGTSTNLVVSGLLENAGHAPLGLFEITHVGLPSRSSGSCVLAFTAPRAPRPPAAARRPRRLRGATSSCAWSSSRRAPRRARRSRRPGCAISKACSSSRSSVRAIRSRRSRPTTALHDGDHLLFVGQARLILDLRTSPGPRAPPRRPPGRTRDARAPLLRGRDRRELADARQDAEGEANSASATRRRSSRSIARASRSSAKLGEVRLRTRRHAAAAADPASASAGADRPDFLVITPLDGEPEAPPIARGTRRLGGLDRPWRRRRRRQRPARRSCRRRWSARCARRDAVASARAPPATRSRSTC